MAQLPSKFIELMIAFHFRNGDSKAMGHILNGKLVKHLNEVDEEAQNQVDLIVRQMAKKQGVKEALKAHDQVTWIGAMNNIKKAAEEIVLGELIYEVF